MAKNLTTGLQRGLRQSIAGGLGTGDLFSTASLDLQFARHKSLDSRVTHTRQSSATYVDGDGVIRTAVTNLLLQSEDFSTTWGLANMRAFGSGSTVNAVIAPDGTLTANHIVEDTSTGNHNIAQASAVVSGSVYSISVYAKAPAQARQLQILVANTNFTITPAAIFNISTGSVVSSVHGTASMVPFGNGWYRCQLTTISATSSGNNAFNFRFYDGATNSYTGDDTSGIYLWGAQLEKSSTVGQYVKTTTAINSAPRFDHDPETGESLGLLIEESRQNLLLQSEDFSTSWTLENATLTVNDITAPNGTLTADKFETTGSYQGAAQVITKAASAITYTGSVFVKSSLNSFTLTVDDGTSTNRGRCDFDISTGTLTSADNNGNFSATTGSIVAYPDGWYRLIVTTTSNTQTTARLRFFSLGEDFYNAWGAQLEAGSFPTSYILTTSSTVTRAADVASITGTNFSSWYNQSEGTAFVEAKNYPYPITGKALVPFAFSDNTYNNRITLAGSTGTNQFNFDVTKAGSFRRAILGNFVSSGLKVSGGYKSTGSAGSLDGAATVTSDTPNIPSVISQLNIGQAHDGTNILNGHIKRLTYWPTRLSNDTLQTITT